MKTNHGYQVVESYLIGPGDYLVRIQREGHLHNHVVWRMNEAGVCSSGTYLSTEEESRRNFRIRKESFLGVSL